MKTFAAFFVLFLAFISSANAHFRLVAPTYRGNEENTLSVPPCGGFNDVNTNAITDFPVTGKNFLITFFKQLFTRYVVSELRVLFFFCEKKNDLTISQDTDRPLYFII